MTSHFYFLSERYYNRSCNKNTFLRFSTSDFFNILFILKTNFNFQRIAKIYNMQILSQLGITNKPAYFLKCLRSWAKILVKKLSLIFRTSVILSSVMLKTSV